MQRYVGVVNARKVAEKSGVDVSKGNLAVAASESVVTTAGIHTMKWKEELCNDKNERTSKLESPYFGILISLVLCELCNTNRMDTWRNDSFLILT